MIGAISDIFSEQLVYCTKWPTIGETRVNAFGLGRPPGYPPGRPQAIPPKNFLFSGVAPANQTKERSVHERFTGGLRNKSSM